MSSKRLSDAIVVAHRISCEENNKQIALLLIEALELDLTHVGGILQDRRNTTGPIEAAFNLHEENFGLIIPGDQKTSL